MRRSPDLRFTNWARTVSSLARERSDPSSEGEVGAVVKSCAERGVRLKVVGGGHSWSDVACTTGHRMTLDRLARVLDVDRARRRITVEAGARLCDLNELLARQGLAFGVLGSISEQSVAGAIATGTHGSSPRYGSFASQVVALRLVTAAGEAVDLDAEREPDLFRAAQVHLGALGVVTRVTLQCVDAFTLEEEGDPMRFDAAVASIPELCRTEEYFKLWWVVHTDWVKVFRYRKTSRAPAWSATGRWIEERIVNQLAFRGLLWVAGARPSWVPAINALVRPIYLRRTRAAARSDRLFNIAMVPRHEEMEYAIDVERAPEALRWMRDVIERERLSVNCPVEIRFAAADEAWMSPAYGRGTCYIGAYMAAGEGLDRYFRLFEEGMLAMGGRPHWGKQSKATAAELRPVCPNLERFEAVRAALDPNGLFLNPFLERTLGVR